MPRIYVRLAEYVCRHPDGTMTVVRGWITFWRTAVFPMEAALYAFVDVLTALAPGPYPFTAAVQRPDGTEITRVDGHFLVESTDGFQGGLPISFTAAEPGTYTVRVECNGDVGETSVRFEAQG